MVLGGLYLGVGGLAGFAEKLLTDLAEELGFNLLIANLTSDVIWILGSSGRRGRREKVGEEVVGGKRFDPSFLWSFKRRAAERAAGRFLWIYFDLD